MINLPFFIAKRYFLSKKEKGYVHLVSLISQFGIAVGTAALILVLSVFNGFEDLVLSMYNVFDPHLKVTTVEGRNFDQKKSLDIVSDQEGLDVISLILEEKVLVEYNNKQYIATIKGVDDNFQKLTNFDSVLISGNYLSDYTNDQVAIVGRGIAYYLSLNIGSVFDNISIYLPNRENQNLLKMDRAFKKSFLNPVGIFGVQQEADSKYIISPITFVQNLINKKNTVSSLDIRLINSKEIFKIQDQLQKKLGDEYLVSNRFEQQDFLYKILNTEKLAVFLIMLFIMIISSFNIIGSLTMLIIDKKKDISSLIRLGLNRNKIKYIFFYKSMLGIISGSFIGILFGVSLALIQQKFGLITMGEGSFVIDSYPVVVLFKDIIIVQLVVVCIGVIASWLPSRIIIDRQLRANII
jgi:lipoprotein-releasing system permease protein